MNLFNFRLFRYTICLDIWSEVSTNIYLFIYLSSYKYVWPNGYSEL